MSTQFTPSDPPYQAVMGLEYALREMFEGKRVTRLDWGDEEFYGLVKNGRLTLHKPDGKFYDWVLTDGDWAGDDWIIV